MLHGSTGASSHEIPLRTNQRAGSVSQRSSQTFRRSKKTRKRSYPVVIFGFVFLCSYRLFFGDDENLVLLFDAGRFRVNQGRMPATTSWTSFESRQGGVLSIGSRIQSTCRSNAIVILAQKKHATYQRDSHGMLLHSLDLLSNNYLRLGRNAENVDLFLFHTGDYDEIDMAHIEQALSSRQGMLKMVNLNGTGFWELPSWHLNDVRSDWVDADIFPVGYRHMCRWFGVKIWQFFDEMNKALGCNYRYILRIDEDSLIHSPIQYDIFDFMLANQFVYGYRLCAYEFEYNRRIAPWLNRWKVKNPPKREMHRGLCGFYNNFFVADLQFFTSPIVARYIKTIDRQGFIYRKRYGDLMIHSHAVYGYAEAHRIHRFLDFTYEHVTRDHTLHPEQGCVVWGGIQEGYLDPTPEKSLKAYTDDVAKRKCTANITIMGEIDLSPTYQHIPVNWRGKLQLKTIMAGKVELPGQGVDSG